MFKLSSLVVASLSLGANAFAPSTSGGVRAPTVLRAEIPVIDEEAIPVIDEDTPGSPPLVSSSSPAGVMVPRLRYVRCRPVDRQLTIHPLPSPSSILVLFPASRAPPASTALLLRAIAGEEHVHLRTFLAYIFSNPSRRSTPHTHQPNRAPFPPMLWTDSILSTWPKTRKLCFNSARLRSNMPGSPC